MYFSEFNLLKIGWGDYYSTQVFIKDEEQEILENAVVYYQNLVINKMNSPLHIEEGLIKRLQKTALNHSIQLEAHEKEFIDYLNRLVLEGEFISQAVFDTFIALLEVKFN